MRQRADSQRSEGIMWPRKREAPEKLFYLPLVWSIYSSLPTSIPPRLVWISVMCLNLSQSVCHNVDQTVSEVELSPCLHFFYASTVFDYLGKGSLARICKYSMKYARRIMLFCELSASMHYTVYTIPLIGETVVNRESLEMLTAFPPLSIFRRVLHDWVWIPLNRGNTGSTVSAAHIKGLTGSTIAPQKNDFHSNATSESRDHARRWKTLFLRSYSVFMTKLFIFHSPLDH